MGKVRPFCRSGLVASILRPYCGLQCNKFCNQGLQYLCQHLPKNDYFSPSTHCNFVRQMMKAQLARFMFAFTKPHSWLVIAISVVKYTVLELNCNFLGQNHFWGV